VSWDSEAQKWRAKIHIDGRMHLLGSFDSEEAAARKYTERASAASKRFQPAVNGVGGSSRFKGIYWDR
jgi:hypothetical protein